MDNYSRSGLHRYGEVQENPMSQLDSIYALLADADAATLQQVQSHISTQLIGEAGDGQGRSGEGPVPSDADSKAVQAEQERREQEETRTISERLEADPVDASDVDISGGDGTSDGTLPDTTPEEAEQPENPEDKLIKSGAV